MDDLGPKDDRPNEPISSRLGAVVRRETERARKGAKGGRERRADAILIESALSFASFLVFSPGWASYPQYPSVALPFSGLGMAAEADSDASVVPEEMAAPRPAPADSDSEGEEGLGPKADGEEDEEDEEDDEDSDSDYDSDYSEGAPGGGGPDGDGEKRDENSREATVRQFAEVLESKSMQKRFEEEEKEYVYHEDLFDFPRDPERWREEDLMELWADAPVDMTKPGWDPIWADEEDWEVVQEERKAGRDPPIAPFYVPYRKHLPAIPDNHHDISNPKSVIEELDRVEEFLKWVSYIFPDGSSYEGTVWDDLAHGKGVYVAAQGLARYEGEWLQNGMEGHGVVEVEVPSVEPVPGSRLEAKMRAEGRIIARDFLSPEDKQWLEMDMEDAVALAGNRVEVPFYEKDEWVRLFGSKPEKGRYKYAGQWKHGRMHGCGVYEVNEQTLYGRFYFGDYVDDASGCDADVSALHAGIAEVAAAKARMFANKPDGMVREDRGPYGDPQHPYFYEEDDVWMAPGFINQFYPVPDYWSTYVQEVDAEREMWLNSFYRSPLRIPMPAELEHWWSKEEGPEFVLINKEPEPDPEDPSKLVFAEDPLILHTRSGRIINYVEDEQHGVRLFWQPPLGDGEEVDPEQVEFLPLGLDEFYGRAAPRPKRPVGLMRLLRAVEDGFVRPMADVLEKWAEGRKKKTELDLKLIDQELEFIEAEICLEEAIEDMEQELKMRQEEEEKRDAADGPPTSTAADEGGEEEREEDDEEEGEDAATPSSFGTVSSGEAARKNGFSSLSLSLPSVSAAPWKLLQSISSWKSTVGPSPAAAIRGSNSAAVCAPLATSVGFPLVARHSSLRLPAGRCHHRRKAEDESRRRMNTLARILSGTGEAASRHRRQGRAARSEGGGRRDALELSVLSMHVPLSSYSLDERRDEDPVSQRCR